MFRMFRSIVVRSLSVQSLSVPSQCRQHQAVSICPRPHKKSLHYYLTTEPHRVTLLERETSPLTESMNTFTHRSHNALPHHQPYHTHRVLSHIQPMVLCPIPTETTHQLTANHLPMDNAIGLHIHRPTHRNTIHIVDSIQHRSRPITQG